MALKPTAKISHCNAIKNLDYKSIVMIIFVNMKLFPYDNMYKLFHKAPTVPQSWGGWLVIGWCWSVAKSNALLISV